MDTFDKIKTGAIIVGAGTVGILTLYIYIKIKNGTLWPDILNQLNIDFKKLTDKLGTDIIRIFDPTFFGSTYSPLTETASGGNTETNQPIVPTFIGGELIATNYVPSGNIAVGTYTWEQLSYSFSPSDFGLSNAGNFFPLDALNFFSKFSNGVEIMDYMVKNGTYMVSKDLKWLITRRYSLGWYISAYNA